MQALRLFYCLYLVADFNSVTFAEPKDNTRGPARYLAIHPRDPLHLTPAQLIVTASEEPITQDQLL